MSCIPQKAQNFLVYTGRIHPNGLQINHIGYTTAQTFEEFKETSKLMCLSPGLPVIKPPQGSGLYIGNPAQIGEIENTFQSYQKGTPPHVGTLEFSNAKIELQHGFSLGKLFNQNKMMIEGLSRKDLRLLENRSFALITPVKPEELTPDTQWVPLGMAYGVNLTQRGVALPTLK